MHAGQLRHRIQIQQPDEARDDFGGQVPTWTTIAVVWADIQPVTGREYFSAQQINAELSHKILIRFQSGIQPTQRVLYGAREFDIHAVINTGERNRELLLLCSERNPEAT